MAGNPNPPRKLLVVITSYGTNQDKYLEKLAQEYQKMPYLVHVVVVSNVAKPVPGGVELVVGLPTKAPWSLPFAHKKIMADRVNDYDLFIYSENDTMVSERNIEAFLRVSKVLPTTDIPGFLRYEEGPGGLRNYINLHGHYHWDPSSPCKHGPYIFASLTNEHSACYLLTRKQLQHAVDSGGFLVPPYQGKYDLACTASTDPYTRCGFRKLICISHLDDFVVHHLPDKYTGPNFDPCSQAFQKQLDVLLSIGKNGKRPSTLIETETKLPAAMFSKDYYEPVRQEVVSAIPSSIRSILSLGCGSGETERWLAARGLRVTAVPLDPVIGACLEGSGIELVCGDFAAVREQLEEHKFDCLFLSNILHLLPNPQEMLSEFSELLMPGGYLLLVSPNLVNLKTQYYKLMGKSGYRRLDNFEESGVQKVSKRKMEEWFRNARCKVETIKYIAAPRVENVSRYIPLALRYVVSTEIIVLGKKTMAYGEVKNC